MTQFNGIMRNFGTVQNAAELISQPIGLVDAADAKPLEVTTPSVQFDDVSFHYGRGKGVIDHLNLTIAPGEKVGIVGLGAPASRRSSICFCASMTWSRGAS